MNKVLQRQLFTLISVFFFWGFVAASNDILIPVFKQSFQLTQAQSQLVSVAFYVAYTVGAILYMLISSWIKQDIIQRYGYKNILATGLLISAAGTILFYPAANSSSFPLMLSGLFIVGLGFSLQQTVANPLAIALGTKETGSQRLTLGGGINNLGTTIGPLIVSFAIFGSSTNITTSSIESVKIPYLILGLCFVLVAILIKLSSIPNTVTKEETSTENSTTPERKTALHYPQLWMGMLAIFIYVGVEVATASNLPAYIENELGLGTQNIAPYVSLYWASLMIGRWTGAIEALGYTGNKKNILKFVAPYLAFIVFLLVNAIANHSLDTFYIYGLIIPVVAIADIASKGDPARMLRYFSILGITALLIGMNTKGLISIYAFTSVGLFCSTLWPCIFALAINGLGKHTTQGSNLLIMMIMGGGIISWLQGIVADATSIHVSYVVGVFCFAYLFFYGWRTNYLDKKTPKMPN
ncbi:MAG: MFS transporter [Bacteroidia bacterium]|nr:MFS transporter [Bacteroidia bacterium]